MVNKVKCQRNVPNKGFTSQRCGKYWVPFSFISSGWAFGPEGNLRVNPEAHS